MSDMLIIFMHVVKQLWNNTALVVSGRANFSV